MADRWWGYIAIEQFPAAWVADVEHTYRAAEGDDPTYYTLTELKLDAMPERLREAFEQLNFESFEREDDGTLRAQDSQLAGGSWAIKESDLIAALMEAELAFEGGDDGDYGNPGCAWWWKPGRDAVEERLAAAESGIVLDVATLRELWTNDVDELRARLCEHFNVESIEPEAAVGA